MNEIARCVLYESKTNPRIHHDEHAHAELTESVRKLGVLQAILVRPGKAHNSFEIVAGHRRFRAAKAAGLETIPANVRELTDVEVLEIQLVENLQRNDLHPLDEAEGYRRLMATKKYDVARIAERTGRSVKYVYDRVKLLQLTPALQKLFRADRITAGHAILLARLPVKAQTFVSDPEGGRGFGSNNLWRHENRLWREEDEEAEDKDPHRGLTVVSVRELQAWIDKNIRFEAQTADPMLFPETVAAVDKASSESAKIIPISYQHQLNPDQKGEERTLCAMSWKRADGRYNTKTCDHVVLGVVAIGPGRGEAFDVCTAKDKCKTHWGAEIRAKQKQAKAKAAGESVPAKPPKKSSWEIQQEREDRARKRFQAAAPAILAALADRVRSISILPGGPIDRMILLEPDDAAALLLPRGETPEDLVRHYALQVLAGELDGWNGPQRIPKYAEALGVDLEPVLKAAEKDAAPAPAEKPKKKARGKKAGAA